MISSSFNVKRLDVAEKTVGYEYDGKQFEGMLVHDDGVAAKRGAIFMPPDWLGVCHGEKLRFQSYRLVRDVFSRKFRTHAGTEAGAVRHRRGRQVPFQSASG